MQKIEEIKSRIINIIKPLFWEICYYDTVNDKILEQTHMHDTIYVFAPDKLKLIYRNYLTGEILE